MHTLHWWAVKAEDEQEAFGRVKDRLINEDGTNWIEWSDWHVVGGGRWSKSQYEDSSDMIISFKNQPEKFMEQLAQCRKFRTEEIHRYMTEMNTDKFISDIVDYISNGGLPADSQRFSMNSYVIKKAADLLGDSYCPESYFFDLDEYTAHMGYILERLDKTEDSKLQYLVPIDFHF